jgi:hypothetical protein
LNQQQAADKISDLVSKAAADNRKVEGQISLGEMASKQRTANSWGKLVRNKIKGNAGGEIKQKKTAINTVQKVIRGHQSRKDLRNTILNTASAENKQQPLYRIKLECIRQEKNNIYRIILECNAMHQARKEQYLMKQILKQRAAAQHIATQAKRKLNYQFKDAKKDLSVQHTTGEIQKNKYEKKDMIEVSKLHNLGGE